MTLHNTWTYNLLAAALFSISTLSIAADKADDTAHSDAQTVNVYASRDNNGWGAVYMSREDIGKDKGHIVNYDNVPDYQSDPALQ